MAISHALCMPLRGVPGLLCSWELKVVHNSPVLTRRLQAGSQWIAVSAMGAEAAVIIEAEEFITLRMDGSALVSAGRWLFCKLSC
jgi:hypothetical protein